MRSNRARGGLRCPCGCLLVIVFSLAAAGSSGLFTAMRETWFAGAFNYEILLSCLIKFTGEFQKSVQSFVGFIYVN